MAKPAIYDFKTLIQAGIDPKTGLPIKLGYDNSQLKTDLKKIERIKDEQMAIHRYKWYNLPFDLTSEEVERLLYYKYSLIIVWDKISEKFYLMPYALDGGIDFYSRYAQVHPVPVADGAGAKEEEKKLIDRLRSYLSTLRLKVLYDVPEVILDEEKAKDFDPTQYTYILRDYTPQLAQTDIPRAFLQESLIDLKSDLLPYMRTALTNSTGIVGVRVQNQDEASNVAAANDSLKNAALTGKMFIPIVGQVEMQEMTGNGSLRSQEFLLALQGIENYQKEIYGIGSNGLMQKASHMLADEQAMNQASGSAALDDGLCWRQWWCTMVNILYGTEMWCDVGTTGIMDTNDTAALAGGEEGEKPSAGEETNE
jgi:hypothetical protein